MRGYPAIARGAVRGACAIAGVACAIAGVACAITIAGCAGTTPLDRRVDEILGRPELRGATVGIRFVRVGDGTVLYERDAEKLLPSASTLKLVSCAGALLALGPQFRSETRVVAAARRSEDGGAGVIDGDLVLVASGDPNLSQRIAPDDRLLYRDNDHSYAGLLDAELVDGDPLRVLRDLARQVAAAGVREVRGSVAVDDGLFTETEDSFVGPVSAACVNDNLLDVLVRPGEKPGDPVRIDHQPKSAAISVRPEATTSPQGPPADVWVEPEPPPGAAGDRAGDPRSPVASFVVRGSVAAGSRPTLRVAPLRDPATAAAALFAEELRAAGIRVSGPPLRLRRGPGAYAGAPTLARHLSPPLSEAIRVILKTSQNVHATMLPPLLGALRGASGDRVGGYHVIRDALAKLGIEPDAVSMQSGSGGGRGDFLSAGWLTRFLVALTRAPCFPAIFEGLPVGGVDGTLRSAFRRTPHGKRVHAKTGTLVYASAIGNRWVYVSKGLAGYFDAGGAGKPDDLVAFAIIVAGALADDRTEGSARIVRAQESIIDAVVATAGLLSGS